MQNQTPEQTYDELRKLYADDPVLFCRDILGVELWDKQKQIIESIRDNSYTAVASGHGVGKAHSVNMILDTPTGRRRWGDLRAGEYVFGTDGKAVKITATHPQGVKPMYRVGFDDGCSTLVCAEHLWSVRGRQERRNKKASFRVLSTQQLLDIGVKRPNGTSLARQWELPGYKPVVYAEQRVPIAPYVMGVWLGDGFKGQPAYGKPYVEVKQRIEECGFAVHTHSDGITQRLQNNTHLFKGAEFQTYSHERFITDTYKYNTVEYRKQLLEGLLDTDGEAIHTGTVCFSSTSKKLAEDVAWLSRSLGCKTRFQKAIKRSFYYNESREKVHCRICYRVSIAMSWNPFSIKHKQEAFKTPSEDRYMKRWIDYIAYSHEEEAMCITVDSKDSLYLANDFIPTHNTFVSACATVWFLFCHVNSRVITTAPTMRQVKSLLWAEIGHLYNRADEEHGLGGRLLSTSLHLSEKQFAMGIATDDPDRFVGQHADHLLLVMDEAPGIEPTIIEAAHGILTNANAKCLMIGNPTSPSGPFFDAFSSPLWKTFHISCYDSPAISDPEKYPGLTSLKWIEERKQAWGESSPIFISRVLGQFPQEGNDTLIPLSWVQRAVLRWMDGRDCCKQSDRTFLGLDVARYGNNKTVLTQYMPNRVMCLKKHDRKDTMKAVNLVIEAGVSAGMNLMSVAVDDTGVGGGVTDRLREMGYPVLAVNFSNQAMDKAHFKSVRDEMYWVLREMFRADEIAIPDDPLLISQLSSIRYKIKDSSKKIEVEGKADIVRRGLKSPDESDSVALAVYASKRMNASSASRKRGNPYRQRQQDEVYY